jgi:sec-independent protein translocase protein TatC
MALVSFPGTAPPYDPEPDEDDEEASGKMSFLEHLEELRKRLIVSLGALLAGFLVALFFIEKLVDFVYGPLSANLNGGRFIYTEPTEGFMLRMKIAALAGLFVALPIILWQAWRFIAPGLYAHEKRFAIPFVFFSTGFFTLGAAFSHYVVFPWSIIFFATFQRPDMQFLPRVEPVFSLYVRMMLAMGGVFEMPTLAFFLARIGLLTPGILVKNFKYAVLIIFIAAAVITPGQDIASQLFMAGPMLVLYGLSIGIAWVFQKRT